MIRTEHFAYFDNDRRYHEVTQLWTRILGTGVWTLVSVQEVKVDPANAPPCPTRPG